MGKVVRLNKCRMKKIKKCKVAELMDLDDQDDDEGINENIDDGEDQIMKVPDEAVLDVDDDWG